MPKYLCLGYDRCVSPCSLVGQYQRLGWYRCLFFFSGRTVDAPHSSEMSGKVKLSPHRPWRPLGLREVEAPTFSDIRLIDGGRVVGPTRRPFLPPGSFLVLIYVRGWVDPRAIVRLEGLGKLKKSTSSGIRTGDLPACSIVPEPTTPPRVGYI
jgi:hypothetical protein